MTTAGAAGAAYVLTRVVQMDQSAEFYGAVVNVIAGTVNALTEWLCATAAPTVGTTAITFSASVPTIVAGTGISVSGATVSLSTPVSVANGGTGTASPALVQGTGITITGSWPNQTIAVATTYAGGSSIVTTGTVPRADGEPDVHRHAHSGPFGVYGAVDGDRDGRDHGQLAERRISGRFTDRQRHDCDLELAG